MTTLDYETLMTAIDKMEAPQEQPRIVFTDAAVTRTQDGWNFRPSRNRSKRLHKKLIKRYGTQERYIEKPACLKVDGDIWIHPSFEEDLMRECKHTAPDYLSGFQSVYGVPIYRGAAPPRIPVEFGPIRIRREDDCKFRPFLGNIFSETIS